MPWFTFTNAAATVPSPQRQVLPFICSTSYHKTLFLFPVRGQVVYSTRPTTLHLKTDATKGQSRLPVIEVKCMQALENEQTYQQNVSVYGEISLMWRCTNPQQGSPKSTSPNQSKPLQQSQKGKQRGLLTVVVPAEARPCFVWIVQSNAQKKPTNNERSP